MDGYQRLLIPTDFSATAQRAVARAADLARLFQARCMLVFVVEKTYFAPLSLINQAPITFRGEGDLLGEAVEYGEGRLKDLRDTMFKDLVCETRVVVAATGAAGILDAAAAYRPDLIVMASHGRSGVAHLLLGSTAEKVVRHATTQVLVIREK